MCWQAKFLSIMELCIPRVVLPQRKKLPWITKQVLQTIKKKKITFQKVKRSGCKTDYERYRMYRNKVTSMLKRSKRLYMTKLASSDIKQFWKVVKYLTKKKPEIPTLTDEKNTASNNFQKAEMLNQFFSKCHNHLVPPLNFADLDDLDPAEDDTEGILCSREEVQHHLETLDISKSNGPDGISARMLKAVAKNIAPSVTNLFNISLKTGCFPASWKLSHIVPISKLNVPTNHGPSNYRPISLLPILSKILERHVYALITDHLSNNCPISDQQWGFQGKKSTVLALLSATYDWFKTTDTGDEICAVFFDIKKAFDTVPLRSLIKKLKALNISPLTIRWIFSYLTGRCQRVVVAGATSQPSSIVSGVPQGSVLGPLLFLIYIDDVSRINLSTGAELILYADDILLYKRIKTLEDYVELQQDIDLLFHWAQNNTMAFNTSKCKYMIVSRKHKPSLPPTLCLGSTPLERVHMYKYLGVILTSNLSWSEHINSVCMKARKLIGVLFRRFYAHTNQLTLFKLYIALIRPHLEYACQVWNPYLKKETEQLEKVQRFALRMCMKQWDASYSDLLELFATPTLADRRKYLSLCVMYTIVHNQVHFQPNIYVPRCLPALRSSQNCQFIQPFAKSSAFKYSFVPSTCSKWNDLPADVSLSPSLSSFKHSLLSYLQE